MTATTEPSPTAARPRGTVDRLLLFAGLLLVIGATVVAVRPVSKLAPPREVAIVTDDAKLDSGPCFLLRHELDVASDKDGGVSQVALLEDGVPLLPHATHQDMRDGALGRFSHWGDYFYLTSTDGSDPRTNGRAYVASIPVPLPAWSSQALAFTALGGAVLALLGLALSRRRRRPLLADVIPLLVTGAALAALLPVDTWFEPWDALRRGEQQILRASTPALAHAATRPGNVTRLFDRDTAPVFEATAERANLDASTRVALSPHDGVEMHEGIARLDEARAGLVGQLDPPLSVSEVGEILLPAHVLQGDTLELALRMVGETGRPNIQINVPVTPSEGVVPLRVTNPLSLFVADPETRFESVEIVKPHTAQGPVLVKLDEVVISSPSAAFLRAPHGRQALALEKDLRPTVWQSVAGRFRLPLPSGAGELLKGSLGLFGTPPDAPVSWRVTYTDADGVVTELLAGEVEAGGTWTELRARLPRSGIQPHAAALTLEADALPAGSALGWSGWRLVDDSRPPQRVLVLLIDTLRRDALGAFGGTEAATPFLDELARGGVRFERAFSQAHWTRPSMPSLMTGRYVAATGVESIGTHLPESYVTLAEAFSEAGYSTVADIANTNAGPAAGLDQGWDQMHHSANPSAGSAGGQLLDERLLKQIRATVEDDLVLYLHLMEAHGPYGPNRAPADADVLSEGEALAHDSALDRAWSKHPTAASRRHWYYRDVESLDAGLASFFETLDEIWGPGATDAATIAMTADHGEYLGEYGQWGHGWHQELPEVVNVPMFLRAPSLPAGVLVEDPVENIDLAPSLLELAQVSPHALGEVDGRSLLPLVLHGDASSHGVALAALGTGQSRLLGLYTKDSGLLGAQGQLLGVLDPRDPGSAWVELRDAEFASTLLGASLGDRLEVDLSAFWDEYLETRGDHREDLWADVDTSSTTIDPLALQQLEALGYLGDD